MMGMGSELDADLQALPLCSAYYPSATARLRQTARGSEPSQPRCGANRVFVD